MVNLRGTGASYRELGLHSQGHLGKSNLTQRRKAAKVNSGKIAKNLI
jgi:hypothetical protein